MTKFKPQNELFFSCLNENMSAYGLFETGKLALPEFETSWEFCGALFSNLKGALFDSAIIWGFFDVPFSNLESALFDSGTYLGFFDALFQIWPATTTSAKPADMSREMKEMGAMAEFPSFRVTSAAQGRGSHGPGGRRASRNEP